MTGTTLERERNKAANPPQTQGPPGAHPFGTGLGAAAGGAAAGALAGTVAGSKIARAIDPTAEEAYWRENYSSRPYVTRGTT